MKKILLSIILLLNVIQLLAQSTNNKVAFAKMVFGNIVNAYGNSKSEPKLKILPKKSQKVIAQYVADKATIEIDETVIDICMGFGKDSANALSIILSHELAHYYNDDNWCSDYAFAIKNSNAQFAKQLRNISKETKIEKESSADSHGLFYAGIAGYDPFAIYNKLLDKIYQTYQLPETVNGYPSKSERKEINRVQKEKIEKLVPVFDVGVILIYAGKYEEAIDCFNYLNKFFPSRENYNNIGTARLLWAIHLKPKQALDFIYPVEIDPISRLNNASNRGTDNDQDKLVELLKAAAHDFEKAISLDHKYTKAYINLACAEDVLGNYDKAIGTLNETPLGKDSLSVFTMKAIAYHHNENTKKANEFFSKVDRIDTTDFNCRLFNASKISLLSAEKVKEDWLNKRVSDNSLLHWLSQKADSLLKQPNNVGQFTETKVEEQSVVSIKSKATPNIASYIVSTKKDKIDLNRYRIPEKLDSTTIGNFNFNHIHYGIYKFLDSRYLLIIKN